MARAPDARLGSSSSMIPVLLGLGANLGDRAATLRAAVSGLERFLNVTHVSPVYETAPMYVMDQGRFLNMVVAAETLLPPQRLLEAVKDLERRLGRTPSRRYGPRRIDIDIVFYDDRSEEHTSELQSLMRTSYAVFCL